MNGITYIALGEMSPEAKERFRIANEKREARIAKMVEECRNGKYDYLIKQL